MEGFRYLDNVVSLQLDEDSCVGCGMCALVCPHGVFSVADRKAGFTDRDLCMECGACAANCPMGAIAVKAGVGCASAIITGWLTGSEPSCDCDSGGCC